jgi:cytochrome oxidase Cu insertion factor (SCO1/SenC/PrrC family)
MKKSHLLTPKTKSKLVIVLLLVIFLGPFLLAWLLHHQAEHLAFDYTNAGTLIMPTRSITDLPLVELPAEQPLNTSQLLGQWWLTYVPPTSCDTACQRNFYHMRQIHTSLGKERTRLRRLALLPEPIKLDIAQLTQRYPQLVIAGCEINAYQAEFGNWGAPGEQGLFLVADPLGHFILSYPGDMAPKAILKDLKRLMKFSKIG